MLNLQLAILQELCKEDELSKKELSDRLRYSVHTMAKAIADLTRGSFILYNRGKYRISSKGRNAVENPEVLQFMKATKHRVDGDIFKRFAQSSACSFIFDNRQNFDGMNADDLLPIVFAYFLITQRDRVAKIQFNTTNSARDVKRLEAATAAFNYLWDEDSVGIEVKTREKEAS